MSGDNEAFEPFERREHAVETAARTIVALSRRDRFGIGWRPKGIDEVAILLESLGYSPEVVAELWYPDLFALARDVSAAVNRYVTDEERREPPTLDWFTQSCRDYAIGSLYSAPWIVAVIGLAIFGASLWSSLSTPLHLATAIAVGVYAAQIISGFFSQAIARRLTFYFLQSNDALMAWTLRRFVLAAVLTTGAASLALYAALIPVVGNPDALLAASFCAGTAIFQLSLAPLYTLRRFFWMVALAVIATAITGATFVLFFHRHVDVPWEPATLAAEVGLLGAAILATTMYWLARRAAATSEPVPPALGSIVRSTLPYALFGALYFASILVDRIAAGIAAANGRGFAYASAYELGADIALLAILPVVGVINVMLEALPRRILKGATGAIRDLGKFDRSMLRFYALGILAVAAATGLAAALGEVVGTRMILSARLGSSGDAALSLEVLRFAIPAYGLVMLGLLNTQMLFFLSRPRAPVIGTAVGTVGSIVTCGWALYAHLPAEAMVGGLLVSALAFTTITTIAAIQTMRRFSYAYYAAY
uniref:Uncharacterized protein n=1 Tax=mine drainage metagenome TaxID=410659 RepID=E6Q495_9ZZZZ